MKLLLTVAALSLATVACSNPKYIQPSAGGPAEKAVNTCTAFFSTPPECVSVHWETGPSVSGFSSFLLKIGRPNQADGTILPETPTDDLAVELWMPDMGHGSRPVEIEEKDRGTYRVTKASLYMAGRWEIRVLLKSGGTVRDQAVVPVDL